MEDSQPILPHHRCILSCGSAGGLWLGYKDLVKSDCRTVIIDLLHDRMPFMLWEWTGSAVEGRVCLFLYYGTNDIIKGPGIKEYDEKNVRFFCAGALIILQGNYGIFGIRKCWMIVYTIKMSISPHIPGMKVKRILCIWMGGGDFLISNQWIIRFKNKYKKGHRAGRKHGIR